MWIPSHVEIVPNIIAENISAEEQEDAPEGMIIELISKQINSRPVIYSRKVQGHLELADSPIYQEVRRRGKKVIRDMHKPPEGEDTCEGGVAREMLKAGGAEEGEDTDMEMDIANQKGKREVEKFLHEIRNGEIVGGPANERRMRHATRVGNKPSFWTCLKVNGCRGCQKQEEEQTIHHVLSGECEAVEKTRTGNIGQG
eukprot:6194204-Pleurochrysis_carterae.AAC.1